MAATFEVGLICSHVADVPTYGSKHRVVSVGGGWICTRCGDIRTIIEVQGRPELDTCWDELLEPDPAPTSAVTAGRRASTNFGHRASRRRDW
jgi:hypothetical protein